MVLSFLTRNKINSINKKNMLFSSESLFDKKGFQSLFENHPDAVFSLNTTGKINFTNRAAHQMLGYNDDQSMEAETIYSNNFIAIRNYYLRNALKGCAQNYQAEVLHKNGTTLFVDITYIPMIDDENTVKGIFSVVKDITKYKRNEQALIEMKDSLDLAQKIGKMGSWEYDIKKDKIYFSKQLLNMLAMDETEIFLSLYDSFQIIHPVEREAFRKFVYEAIDKQESYSVEITVTRKDGTTFDSQISGYFIFDEAGNMSKFAGIIQDISARKKVENRLQESESRFQRISDTLEVGIFSHDVLTDTCLFASKGFEKITGYSVEALESFVTWESIVHPEDLEMYNTEQLKIKNGESLTIEYRIIDKQENNVWVLDQSLPVFNENGKLIRIDGILTDITEQKRQEKNITHLAYYDFLTGLPNRNLYYKEVDKLTQSSIVGKSGFSLIFINIDRFRTINNSLGPSIGDQLLIQISERIKVILPEDSTLARMIGDEFGVILPKDERSIDPVALSKTIIDSLNEPFYVEDYELYITTSLGISSFPENGTTLDELIKNTDTALYRAKNYGKNNYQIYSPQLNIRSFKQYHLESDLRKSIENNELVIYFQPRIEATTGKIVSAESLIRWMHPIWGEVSPKEFIPIAEENGYINELGDWILKHVCLHLKKWEKEQLPIVPISVNISAQRFLKSDWKSVILEILASTQVNPELIEFEITETTMIQHEKVTKAAFQTIREMGIKIALDDFGTGYSSLSYISDYPIDTLKIDQTFIKQITKSTKEEVIIKSLIYMAKGLDMNVVAEGVETIEQLNFLKQQECQEIQGYIFSKPVPEKTFIALLKKQIIKPILYHESKVKSERRGYFRIPLVYPLAAQMTLTEIQGVEVAVGKTEVLIEDIGPGGLRFLSIMDLPVRPDILYQFETTILDKKLPLLGYIVWKEEVKGILKYGFSFTINENERDELIKLLNTFSLKLRSKPILPSCSFVQEEKIPYLKRHLTY
ncbi:EAL domain-containing protein [Caldibacillus lycopersici]|uniref:EAL domain-containing protein n=1 Tax=Perspicuibacillus lycopersici TaxID=1325689 RepID=A0AAE3IQH7_9BACI|nr:EAL domain-containing protein [Perspicuibacillus lycopersici]MCU9612547.1 EAL domain-containing protein [Perspicuibacillus lycopersici]